MEFNVEFGDILELEISEEGKLELTIKSSDHEYRHMICWMNAHQVDRLIMELKILKQSGNIKYPDEKIGKA